ncbi:MAG: c(7)-type cytochrome triheme domain-containing protein [Deltaproteobacteria bacterium]
MLRRRLMVLMFFAAPALSYGAVDVITLDSKIESMQKAGVGPVKFPHAKHQLKLKCGECHPKIFKDALKANDINMKKNMDGQACGSANCHNSDKTFPLFECAKCHTNVKAGK